MYPSASRSCLRGRAAVMRTMRPWFPALAWCCSVAGSGGAAPTSGSARQRRTASSTAATASSPQRAARNTRQCSAGQWTEAEPVSVSVSRSRLVSALESASRRASGGVAVGVEVGVSVLTAVVVGVGRQRFALRHLLASPVSAMRPRWLSPATPRPATPATARVSTDAASAVRAEPDWRYVLMISSPLFPARPAEQRARRGYGRHMVAKRGSEVLDRPVTFRHGSEIDLSAQLALCGYTAATAMPEPLLRRDRECFR